MRKDYPGADVVCYLPLDGRIAAQDFIKIIQPSLVVFVKYEFWYYYLMTLKKHNIPALLISATFRESGIFFKWYGGLFRKLLYCFNYLLVQDAQSQKLLSGILPENRILLAGDTRYDRVSAIAAAAKFLPVIETFKGENKLLIAGSTWPEDEKMLASEMRYLPPGWKLIIAPHEVTEAHVQQMLRLFEHEAVLYSALAHLPQGEEKKVLVIDNIGMLSALYRYGEIAFIGGGFNKGGIHNILEPAVFGLPVLFGPVWQKFVEANEMIAAGFAFPVENEIELKLKLGALLQDDRYKIFQPLIRDYVAARTGATEIILNLITKEHWLA